MRKFLFSTMGLIVVGALVFLFRDKIRDLIGRYVPSLGEKLDQIGG